MVYINEQQYSDKRVSIFTLNTLNLGLKFEFKDFSKLEILTCIITKASINAQTEKKMYEGSLRHSAKLLLYKSD